MPTPHKSKKAAGKLTDLARALTNLRQKLGLTRQELADKLGVKESTISVWEIARRRKDYRPSADILVKFADFAAREGGPNFDADCIWLLQESGALTAATSLALDRRREPRSSKPGEVISVPLIDNMSGYRPEASFVDHVELPANLIPSSGALGCVRIERTDVMSCLPFAAGGLLVVDQSETDLERLLMGPTFVPVAMYYSCLPNLLPGPPPIKQGPLPPIEQGQPISPEGLPGSDKAERDADEQVSAAIQAGKPIPEALLEEFYRTKTNAEELSAKYFSYMRDPDKKWNEAGIHVGWLVLDQAGYDGESERPWRIVSRGASVGGLWTGGSLAVTRWDQGPVLRGMQAPLSDLIIENQRILGRVVLWLPEWSSRLESSSDPREKPDSGAALMPAKNVQAKAKSRKEPK